MSTYDLWEVSGKLAGKAREFADPAAARKAVTASKTPAALVHDGAVHTWSPGITAAQKAVLSAAVAFAMGGAEIEPPGPLAVKPVPPRARVAVRRADAVEAAPEESEPIATIAGRVMLPSTGPCAACGAPSAPYSSKLHEALRDLCDADRDRAQKHRSAHKETPEQGRAWVVALVQAKAAGEPPPGRAMQGGPRKVARAKPVVVKVTRRVAAPASVAPAPAPVVAPAAQPADAMARVVALLERVGGVAALESIVADVERLRAVA